MGTDGLLPHLEPRFMPRRWDTIYVHRRDADYPRLAKRDVPVRLNLTHKKGRIEIDAAFKRRTTTFRTYRPVMIRSTSCFTVGIKLSA